MERRTAVGGTYFVVFVKHIVNKICIQLHELHDCTEIIPRAKLYILSQNENGNLVSCGIQIRNIFELEYTSHVSGGYDYNVDVTYQINGWITNNTNSNKINELGL